MMRHLGIAFAVAAPALLSACATPYQSSTARQVGILCGYDDFKVTDTVWYVGFTANTDATYETLQTYWLYRCAELTLEKGFAGFHVMSDIFLGQDSSPSRRQPVQIAALILLPYPLILPNHEPPQKLQAYIQFLNQPFMPRPPKIFDAALLIKALEPHVNGPKCDHGNVCVHSHDYLKPPAP